MGKEWMYNMLRRIGLIRPCEPDGEEYEKFRMWDGISIHEEEPEKKPRPYKKASKNGIKFTAEETAMICEITRLSGRCSEACGSCVLYREDNHGEGRDGE